MSVDATNAVPATGHADEFLVAAHNELNVSPLLSVMLKAGNHPVEHRHTNVSDDDLGAVRCLQLPEQCSSDLHSFLSRKNEFIAPLIDSDDTYFNFLDDPP